MVPTEVATARRQPLREAPVHGSLAGKLHGADRVKGPVSGTISGCVYVAYGWTIRQQEI
jgi:hypothetical protein